MRSISASPERLHGPAARESGDAREVAQQRRAVRSVRDLGMKLHAPDAPRVVGDGGERCAVGRGDGAEAGRHADDAVAVAHPYLLARARRPDAVKQRAVGDHVDIGAAELAMLGGDDLAAQRGADELLAVADAEHRNAQLEDARRRARAPLPHAPRPGRPRGSAPAARRRGCDRAPRCRARSRNTPRIRAPAGRSAASPGCRNRGSAGVRLRVQRDRPYPAAACSPPRLVRAALTRPPHRLLRHVAEHAPQQQSGNTSSARLAARRTPRRGPG